MKSIFYNKKINKREIILLIFTIPAVIFFIAVAYYPLLSTIKYSITDWYMGKESINYIGLKNFAYMLTDSLAIAAFKNTLLFAAYATFVGNTLALLLALILDMSFKSKNFLRSVFFIPCLLSPIVVSAIFGDILQYNGFFNEIFSRIGLNFLITDWFGNGNAAFVMLIILNAWQWAGYGSVIYMAGLQAIPTDYYEAAKIDGSKRLNTFFRITLTL